MCQVGAASALVSFHLILPYVHPRARPASFIAGLAFLTDRVSTRWTLEEKTFSHFLALIPHFHPHQDSSSSHDLAAAAATGTETSPPTVTRTAGKRSNTCAMLVTWLSCKILKDGQEREGREVCQFIKEEQFKLLLLRDLFSPVGHASLYN